MKTACKRQSISYVWPIRPRVPGIANWRSGISISPGMRSTLPWRAAKNNRRHPNCSQYLSQGGMSVRSIGGSSPKKHEPSQICCVIPESPRTTRGWDNVLRRQALLQQSFSRSLVFPAWTISLSLWRAAPSQRRDHPAGAPGDRRSAKIPRAQAEGCAACAPAGSRRSLTAQDGQIVSGEETRAGSHDAEKRASQVDVHVGSRIRLRSLVCRKSGWVTRLG